MKKDIEGIAKILRETYWEYDGDNAADVIEHIGRGLAGIFTDRDDDFDRDRFLRACRFAK